jgi:hypothetical protein
VFSGNLILPFTMNGLWYGTPLSCHTVLGRVNIRVGCTDGYIRRGRPNGTLCNPGRIDAKGRPQLFLNSS